MIEIKDFAVCTRKQRYLIRVYYSFYIKISSTMLNLSLNRDIL